jgi:hypothetical protein
MVRKYLIDSKDDAAERKGAFDVKQSYMFVYSGIKWCWERVQRLIGESWRLGRLKLQVEVGYFRGN